MRAPSGALIPFFVKSHSSRCGYILNANDFASDLFALRCFDFYLRAVYLVLDVGAHDEVGSVHGLVRIRAARVLPALGLEEEVIGLMLVFLVDCPGWLRILQNGRALNLRGQRRCRYCDACDSQNRGFRYFMHDSTSQKIVPAQTFLLKIPPARNIENPECAFFEGAGSGRKTSLFCG